MVAKISGRKLLAASIAVLPFTTAAYAQDAGNQGRTYGLEEVVVTARRQMEAAQSIPIAVSAFTGEKLDQFNVASLEDLTRLTPGLRFSAEGGGQNTTISLRGLSKIPVGDGAPAVVTYFSDVPLSNDGTNLPTFDLANIQVLKGPQGTLFGRNTIGGAVLVSPKEPVYVTEGYLKGGVGNYNRKTFEGALNAPVIEDVVALRIAGQVRRRDGFQENLGPGPDLDDVHQHSLRASLLWDITDNLTNTLIWDSFWANESAQNTVVESYRPGVLSQFGGPQQSFLFAPFEADLAAQTALAQARGPDEFYTDSTNLFTQRRLTGITNKTEFQFGDNLTFRNIFGYRTTEVSTNNANDGLPTLQADASAVPLMALAALNPALAALPPSFTVDRLSILKAGQLVDKEQITNEVQLIGTAIDDRMDWILGGFYLKEEPNGAQGSWFNQFQLASSAAGIALSQPQVGTSHVTTESKSVFAQMGLDLSDWVLDGLTFNFGYRYTRDEISACGYNSFGGTSVSDANFLTQSECEGVAPELTLKDSAPTWTVGFDYQINGNNLVYITSRRGYRSGGANLPVFDTPGTAVLQPYQFVDRETVDDIELGVKSDFDVAGMPARINLALYEMKYSDAVQFINVLGVIDPTDPAFPNRGSFGLNAGDLTVQGAELEVSLAPTQNLTFTAAGSYTDQKVDKLSIPAGFSYSERDVTLPTPKTSATLAFQWTLPWQLLEGDFTLSGDYYWTDSWQAQTVELPSYELANFRFEWNDIVGSFDAALFVTNAFDEEYATAPVALVPSLPVGTAIYGAPRMFGMDVTYRFGR